MKHVQILKAGTPKTMLSWQYVMPLRIKRASATHLDLTPCPQPKS